MGRPASTDLQDHLVELALEGILATDLSGTIRYVNGTAQRLLQVPEADLLGQFLGVAFPPNSVLHLLPNLIRLARDPSGFEGEILLAPRSGPPILVRLAAEPFPRRSPELLLFRFLDWREVNALAQELREAGQLAVLGTLTRAMAHEILNPVTVIGGHVRQLMKSPLPTGEAERAADVLASVETLESLVRTVEHFNALPRPNFQRTSLKQVVHSALERVRGRLTEAGIDVDRTETSALPELFLDAELMSEALTAVLLNALERMPEGGTLSIQGAWDGTWASLSIEDTGPRPDRESIEEDMSPVHVVRSFSTDLNLAVARRVVEEHGGALDLSPVARGGLAVQIDLPGDRRKVSRNLLT